MALDLGQHLLSDIHYNSINNRTHLYLNKILVLASIFSRDGRDGLRLSSNLRAKTNVMKGMESDLNHASVINPSIIGEWLIYII